MTITLTMKIFLTHELLGFGSSHSCLPFPAPLISISGKSRIQKQRRKAKLLSEGSHRTSCRAAADVERWELHASGTMHFMWQPSRCLRLVNCLHLGTPWQTHTDKGQAVCRAHKGQVAIPLARRHPVTPPGNLAPQHPATLPLTPPFVSELSENANVPAFRCFIVSATTFSTEKGRRSQIRSKFLRRLVRKSARVLAIGGGPFIQLRVSRMRQQQHQ